MSVSHVDCRVYIGEYLSAHADGELRGEELRAAEEHVRTCSDCGQRLEEERALKTLLHRQLRSVAMPAALRARVQRALDEAQAAEPSIKAVGAASRPAWRRTRIWLPSAIAALLLLGFAGWKLGSMYSGEEIAEQEPVVEGGIPLFETAIHHLDRFDKKFVANIPSESFHDISDAYMGHHMPGTLWNFGPAGYPLVGGRIEKLADGRTASFTYYRGDNGGILCVYMHFPQELPEGAVHEVGSHSFYTYRGYSIVVSKYPKADFVCVLTSRLRMDDFMEAIAEASE